MILILGQYKHGITSQDAAGDNEFRDLQVRWGHKFSDKVAMKVNFAYLRGTDWIADSEADKLGRVDENGVGLTRAAHHHDGINIYGDEVATNINGVAQIMEGMGLLPAGGSALVPSTVVTRTGYREVDLTDHVARSKKADWGLIDCINDDCPFDFDNDIDNDGVCGDIDNCVDVANSGQV